MVCVAQDLRTMELGMQTLQSAVVSRVAKALLGGLGGPGGAEGSRQLIGYPRRRWRRRWKYWEKR